MKTHSEIMQLLQAGFTREEILSMPEETETPQAEPEQPAAPEAPAENPLIQQMQETLNTINARLLDLQAANIVNQMQPEAQPHKMTAEEALSELIGPTGAK
jgi:hypothetical protein